MSLRKWLFPAAILGGLFLFGGKAKAAIDGDDDDDDGDLPDLGNIDDPVIFVPAEPTEPPPPPPDPKKKNYVGSGYAWPSKARFPNERSFGLFLQQLGYVTNPGDPAWSVISGDFMKIVRQFQRDFNVARLAQTVTEPQPGSLSTDGLIGKNTIAAMLLAEKWVQTLGVSWFDLVALG
jgi:hypothetical protein